ncbi:helix-turn-helix domain-containing protein [Haloechinothrix sp. YIM 98757]|uniref:Helix-turn-helix domain-containing protein n=1 Tax=Haloechinothrix aidingensis TaxID=2752311 RepID=A0A838AB13_9PSEU|nr:helix-turn-helix domain-containing protein [Haloechinothrix aidingensis]
MTYAEAAELLRVSPRTVRRMVTQNRLRTVDVGGCKRIPRSEVERAGGDSAA